MDLFTSQGPDLSTQQSLSDLPNPQQVTETSRTQLVFFGGKKLMQESIMASFLGSMNGTRGFRNDPQRWEQFIDVEFPATPCLKLSALALALYPQQICLYLGCLRMLPLSKVS